MKFNKIQKIITGVGILAFIYVGYTHFYSVQINADRWFSYNKDQKKFIQQCVESINELNNDGTGRMVWDADETCVPPKLININWEPITFRQMKMGETLFSYLTVATILVLLLLVTKDGKKPH